MLAISLLLAAGAGSPETARERNLWVRVRRCGFVFNVDGPGPPGDGIHMVNDHKLLIERRPNEQKKRECLSSWARSHGFVVRQIPIRK